MLNIYASRMELLKANKVQSRGKNKFPAHWKISFNSQVLHHAVPNQWKKIIKTTDGSCNNNIYLSHHLVAA